MPTRLKTLAIAAALAAGTSSAAMAQYTCPAGYTYYGGVCQPMAAPAPVPAPAPAYPAYQTYPAGPVSGAAAGGAAGAAQGGAAAGPVGAVVGGALGTATGAVSRHSQCVNRGAGSGCGGSSAGLRPRIQLLQRRLLSDPLTL